jgi:hypothetical protein
MKLPVTPERGLMNGDFVPSSDDRVLEKPAQPLPRDISAGDGVASSSRHTPATVPPPLDPEALWPPTHALDDRNGGNRDRVTVEEEAEGEEYRLLPANEAETPETRIRNLEATLFTANHLIRALHKSVDVEREAKEGAEWKLENLTAKDSNPLNYDGKGKGEHKDREELKGEPTENGGSRPSASSPTQEALNEQVQLLAARDAEIADLKAALDFANKLLSSSYRRAWELWRWVDGLSAAQAAAVQRSSFLGLDRLLPQGGQKRVGDIDSGKGSDPLILKREGEGLGEGK